MAAPTSNTALNNPSHATLHTAVYDVRMFSVVGNGSDESVKIQAAIDAMPASGGTLLFPGTVTGYGWSSITLSTDNVHLKGEGRSIPVTLTGATTNILVTGDNVSITGFSFNTTGSTATQVCQSSGTDFIFADNEVTSAGVDGGDNGRLVCLAARSTIANNFFTGHYIALSLSTGADDGEIRNNTFGTFRVACYIYGVSDVSIVNNKMLSIGGSGITQGYDAILVEESIAITIAGNHIEACREHGIYVSGGSQDVTISGNTVRNAGQDSIKCLGAPCKNVTIVGNTVNGGNSATRAGINVGNTQRLTIQGNTVYDQNVGIQLFGGITGCSVTGNTVQKSTGPNLRILDSQAGNKAIVVSGNMFLDADTNDTGGWSNIDVTATSAYTTAGIFITGNFVGDVQAGATTNYGIVLATVGGSSTVASCAVFGNYGYGHTSGLIAIGTGWTSALVGIQDYTASNVTPDRTYDANATSTDELADVLGTLIADLAAVGVTR